MRVKTIMKHPACAVDAGETLTAARGLMRRAALRELLVVRGGRPVGTLGERDVLQASASTEAAARAHDWPALLEKTRVEEAMTGDPVVVGPATPLGEAARLARERGAELLAVVEDGLLVGTVAAADLLGVLSGLLAGRRPPALRHILAAVSLRPGGPRSIAEALRLAGSTGATVTALHILPHVGPGSPGEGATAETVMWAERTRRKMAERAREAMRRLGRAGEIRCEVTEGVVATEIARGAEDLGADLIVVGCATGSRWERLIPSTTAEEVARLASSPVLAVATGPRA